MGSQMKGIYSVVWFLVFPSPPCPRKTRNREKVTLASQGASPWQAGRGARLESASLWPCPQEAALASRAGRTWAGGLSWSHACRTQAPFLTVLHFCPVLALLLPRCSFTSDLGPESAGLYMV